MRICFKLLLVFNLLFALSAISQEKVDLQTELEEIDSAFQTSNWKEVARFETTLNHRLKKVKLGAVDSLLIICSLEAYYRIAIANAWLNKAEVAKQTSQKKLFNKSYFPNQQKYSLYYKLASQGKINFISNQFDSALINFESAYKEALTSFSYNNTVYFDALKNLVIYYLQTNDNNKALALLWKARLFMENQNSSQEKLAEIYYYQYLVYYTKANYPAAIEYSQKCIDEINRTKAPFNKILLSDALQALGISHFHLQEYHAAREYLHKSLDIQLSFKNYKKPELALNYDYLGRVYRKLGNIELAISYKLKAGKIYEEIYNSKENFKPNQVYFSLIFYYEERINKNKKYIDVELYESINASDYIFTLPSTTFSEKNIPFLIHYYSMSAFNSARLKDNEKLVGFYRKAIPYFKKALALKEKILGLDHIQLAPYYLHLSNLFQLDNQLDSAIFYNQKAINVQQKDIKEDGNKIDNFYITSELLSTFSSKAKCFIAKTKTEDKTILADYKSAINSYLMCDKIADELRLKFIRTEDNLLLSRQMDEVNNEVIKLCFEMIKESDNEDIKDEYLRQAFYFSQKNKAKLLEELVAQSGAAKFGGIPDSLIKLENEIKNKIALWERNISRSVEQKPDYYHCLLTEYRNMIEKNESLGAAYSDSLFKYTKQSEQLIEIFGTKYPKYYELKYNKKVLSINELQNRLDENSVILDYHISDSTIEIFLITKDKFSAQQVKCKESIDSVLNIYRQTLSGYYKKADFMKFAYDKFLKNSQKLYQYLLKPIEKTIETKEKLIIIVSEALSTLPFETLLANNNGASSNDLSSLNYVIKKYNVVYNYSTNLWINSINKSITYRKNKISLLAMAPVFDPNKMFTAIGISSQDNLNPGKMAANEKSELSPLPATKIAIDEICQIAENKQTKSIKLLYENANKSAFMQTCNDKKYIVLATHGRSDDQYPKLSGLYFATEGSEPSPGNAFLYANETFNLNLASDLLVLYACETGVGVINKGEGVMTVSRGFMASGAANIVHTLWSIQDVSTKDLVVDMFNSVYENTSYSKSLRISKLKMIDYGIIPFHWSGLVILGN